MAILVTGGAGYIGSHACVELLGAGFEVVVVDNLCNSKREAVRRVRKIAGKPLAFHKVDLLDRRALKKIFAKYSFEAVIHFAGLKAVGESIQMPLKYYWNNLTGTLILAELMTEFQVKNLVFSSSATVYGDPHKVPVTEDFPLIATNPYGRTKLMIEQILGDLHRADPAWNIILLRYFNPVGAHASGRIGEDPNGVPTNLLPYISQVAVGKLKELSVFGGDYPTPDGTGVRDFIHVVDLARGHVKAVEKLRAKPGLGVYNLGTGKGYSVLDAVQAFKKASGQDIPYKIVRRRPGDVANSYADPAKAGRELGWKATMDLDAMCADAWRWQSQNPNGYE